MHSVEHSGGWVRPGWPEQLSAYTVLITAAVQAYDFAPAFGATVQNVTDSLKDARR